ncbi:exonuclease 1-like isoform X2 [Anneissia japonica]|uniref:exonuclease 1-like isoform X2 n=1 Tax=Anneissia japonica TaxID=1529436 RepID=UPI0014258E7D|nr:exonuclease 1-like isoform X2 [Anneissia japonica]
MGIHGLIPFVKDATEQINIRKYAGYTVAVDTYCWLHKGAFACAMQLAKGEVTDQYVRYCMKFVNMLRSFNIKPILVFDGCNLPSKKHVENSRRERRETFMKKGKQFLREGKVNEARDCFTRSINITSKMALEVMEAARSVGVDCIVAPYEADSQLAYLNKVGIAKAIITEDSDLIAFGCDKVVVKMDISGNGLEISSARLDKAMKIGTKYTMDKFRYMCIISGCDYLSSLPGIGLGKARKLFLLSSNPDVHQLLKKMPMHLKMKLAVGEDYIQGFHQANNTFLYQLAFDPLKRKLVPLNPYPPEINPEDIKYAGKYIDDDVALQMALGNVDVNTGRKVAHYVPESKKYVDPKTPCHLLSIWHDKYKPGPKYGADDPLKVQHPSTKNSQTTVRTPAFKRKGKKSKERENNFSLEHESDLASMYGSPSKSKKRSVPETPEKDSKVESARQSDQPKVKRNRFAVKRLSSKERKDLINEGATQKSRFFTAPTVKPNTNSSDDESENDSKNTSILLAELEGTQDEVSENDKCDEIAENNIPKSAQSKLQKFKRSSPLTSDRQVPGTSCKQTKVDDSSRTNTPLCEQNQEKQNMLYEYDSELSSKRPVSSKGAFSWKRKIGKNEKKLDSCKHPSGKNSNSSIKSFLSSFRRNSDNDLNTPVDVNDIDQKSTVQEHPDVIVVDDDSDNELSQTSFKLSQISDLYSIDGDASQSQQNSTQLSQSQQNLTQPNQSPQNSTQLSQSQQNLTQLSQSQQNWTQPSQSQQNLTQLSQSQQNSTRLSQSQQNSTQPSRSQQKSTQPTQLQNDSPLSDNGGTDFSIPNSQSISFKNSYEGNESSQESVLSISEPCEPRLPQFDTDHLSIVNVDGNSQGRVSTNNSVDCVTSSYFTNKTNTDGNKEVTSRSTSATMKQNKVRCGLQQRKSAPCTPVSSLVLSSHIGPSKNVGLRRRNGTKRKAFDENSTRQIKMTKFFASSAKMSSECPDKLKIKPLLSPVNTAPECTPESVTSVRLIEGAKVQRNIFI